MTTRPENTRPENTHTEQGNQNADADLERRAKLLPDRDCDRCEGRGHVHCALCLEDSLRPCTHKRWASGPEDYRDTCPKCLGEECSECHNEAQLDIVTCWECGWPLCITCIANTDMHHHSCEAELPTEQWVIRQQQQALRKLSEELRKEKARGSSGKSGEAA